jgi:hypothetical protein
MQKYNGNNNLGQRITTPAGEASSGWPIWQRVAALQLVERTL